MTVTIAPYRPELRGALESCLDAYGAFTPGSWAHTYWVRMLEAPAVRSTVFLLALDASGAVRALALALKRPLVDGAARMAFYMLPDDDTDAIAVGRPLSAAMEAALAEHGVTRHLLAISDTGNPGKAVAEALGFEKLQSQIRMGWDSDGTWVAERKVPGVILSRYDGGDTAVDRELSELLGRAFSGDILFPGQSAEDIAETFVSEDIWMMLAREDGTGALVGMVEVATNGFVPCIAIARRYWGKGLAEFIGAVVMNECVRQGHTHLFSLIRVGNQPSLSVHERMGWRRTGICESYISRPSNGQAIRSSTTLSLP